MYIRQGVLLKEKHRLDMGRKTLSSIMYCVIGVWKTIGW